MFTGIIEETGKILSIARGGASARCGASARLSVSAAKALDGTKIGDSVAVNGVCLTVTAVGPARFFADVMGETLARSTLGTLRRGDPVNLERALLASSRLGGHIVAGHVDGTGMVRSIRREGIASVITIGCDRALTAMMAVKGSIAIDGVSLTLCSVREGIFSVSVIPHTLVSTCLGSRRAGSSVNVECDLLARYAALSEGSAIAGAHDPRSADDGASSVSTRNAAADKRLYSSLLERGFIRGGQ